MKAYEEAGGNWSDLKKLELSAINLGGIFPDLDPLGYMADTADTKGEIIELTSELLAGVLRPGFETSGWSYSGGQL
jgi:hypothetical protein